MKRGLQASALLIALMLSGTTLFAQKYVKQIVVANGGLFEFMPPFVDNSTVGVYDPYTDIYQVIDTIQTQSVQDLVVADGVAYVAAQDRIVKYDLDTYQRLDTLAYANVRSITLSGDLMIVGKFFGTGAFLDVYNRNTFAFEFSIPEVTSTVLGAAVIGDSLYVPYNEKGTVDQCPPFGCFNDTIGRIAVIHIPTESFVRDINLDTIGSGAGQIFQKGNEIYVVSNQYGVLTTYNNQTGTRTTQQLGISGGYTLSGDSLIAAFQGGSTVGIYNVDTQTVTNNGWIVDNYLDGDYDWINNRFYGTKSDFFSFGSTHIINEQGMEVDSFATAISPEGLAIDFRTGNAAPIARRDSFFTEQENPVVIDVQANDFDFNQQDELTTSVFSDASWGNTNVLNGDSIEYLSFLTYEGLDSLRYVVCDNGTPSLCDTNWVILVVDNNVGIAEEQATKPVIETFPNPTNEQLNVRFSTSFGGTLQLTDLQGRVLYTDQIVGDKGSVLRVDVRSMATGVYLLQLSNEEIQVQQKWVKQ